MPNQLAIQAPSGQLARGETLVVPIVLSLEKPLKVRGIHARFWGAEETKATYTTTGTDSQGNTTTDTHTAVEHVNVVDQQSLLAGHEQQGFFRGLWDSLATSVGGGRHEIMEPGEYPFSIEVTVPQDAPPAHAGKNSRIFYELSARVAIPLAVDLKAKHSFDLPPLPGADPPSQPVRVRYPGDAGAGLLDSLLAPGVRVELALAADVAREGETIEGIIVTESDKPLGAQSPVGELGRDRAQSGPGSPRHRSLRQPACPNLLIPLIGGALLADIFATRRVSRAANLARHTVQYRLVCPVGAGCALGQGSQDSRPRPAAKKVVWCDSPCRMGLPRRGASSSPRRRWRSHAVGARL